MGLAVPSPQEGSALLQDRGINRAPAKAGSWAGPAELPALTLRTEQGLPQELGVDSRAQSCRTFQSQGTAEERGLKEALHLSWVPTSHGWVEKIQVNRAPGTPACRTLTFQWGR